MQLMLTEMRQVCLFVRLPALSRVVVLVTVFMTLGCSNRPGPAANFQEIGRDVAIESLRRGESSVFFVGREFRQQLTEFVKAGDYADAIALLDLCQVDFFRCHDPVKQVYFAVGGNTITIPGAGCEYQQGRDWLIPGTEGPIESLYWHNRAWRFAFSANSQLREVVRTR